MLYTHFKLKQNENQALLDTGAIHRAMSEKKLHGILLVNRLTLIQEVSATGLGVLIATSNLVSFRKQGLLRFFIAGIQFETTFIILHTLGNVSIYMSFFQIVLGDVGQVEAPDICFRQVFPTTQRQRKKTTAKCARSEPPRRERYQPTSKSWFQFVPTLKLVSTLARQKQLRPSPGEKRCCSLS